MQAHPDWIIYGSETAATVQSRGVYHFPLASPTLADDDMQCSSLGNSATSWGAKSPEAVLRAHRATIGQFIWAGIDYIGEPTPYHTKNCYFAPVDTAVLPKDAFYIYRSDWNESAPTLHLFPHWDWSPGQPVDVRIATNAKCVELFLNDNTLGRRENVDLVADYIVPYAPGILTAVAYDEEGREVGRVSRRSFGDAVAAVCETKRIGALNFTEISAVDKDGNPVENANSRVHIDVAAGAKLLALDNGDSTDFEQYQGTTTRRLFGGKLLAISEGDISAPISARLCDKDIPVRKIELAPTDAGGLTFSAKILPPNATDAACKWRLSDAAGIDSHIATLQGSTISPLGDGTVYVRCAAANGKPHPDIISIYPVELTGYGKPHLNPFSFISAGLFTHSNGTLTAGNERGMATARDRESHMGFADLDFGTGGQDITLWLFPLSGEPFNFDIYNTFPPEGKPLYTAFYELGTQWNAYQPVTYTLPHTLTDIQTLTLVFRQKVHVKGFQFSKK
jgi:beta-galactosidase